ncbi:hypothetical protein ACI789_02045 [Geodermatophilus sp. SYSU D00965]
MTETRQPRSTTERDQAGKSGRTATAVPAPRTAEPAPQVQAPRTLTVRLPLVTITVGPLPAAPAPTAAPPAAPRDRGTFQKVVFYGGVAAAGAMGALEWPVALAVAAGTWVAQHTAPVAARIPGRPASRPMAQGEPAGPSPDPDAAGG